MNRGHWSCNAYHDFEWVVDDHDDSDDLVKEKWCMFTGRYRMTNEYHELFDQASKLFVNISTHDRADIYFNVMGTGEIEDDILTRLHGKTKLYTATKRILWDNLSFNGTRDQVKDKKKELDAVIYEIDLEDKKTVEL